MIRRSTLAWILALLTLTACGGSGSSHAPPVPVPGIAQTAAKTVVTLHFTTVPKTLASVRQRHALAVAYLTGGVLITAYTSPKASNPTPVTTVAADISTSSSLCVPNSGGRSCSVPIPLTAGTYDYTAQTYDAAPVSNSFSGAHALGYGTALSQTITAYYNNSVSFTVSSVISSIAINVFEELVDFTATSTQHIAVTGLDATGNNIIVDGRGYIDVNGNSVTVNLTATNSGPAVFTLSPTSITAPTNTGIVGTYTSGILTAAQEAGTLPVTISAAVGGTTLGTAVITLLHTWPMFEFEVTTTGSGADGITSGPDGKLWFTEATTNKVGKVTTAGVFTEYSTGITASAGLQSITTGSDGNLWFGENSKTKIGKITPTGTVTEYSTGLSAGAAVAGMSLGPDNNVWFAENGLTGVGKITTAGVITQYTTGFTANGHPNDITSGPDGNMWFAEQASGKVGKITTAGVVTLYSTSSGTTGPNAITTGGDGNLWFTLATANKIGKITTSGTETEYALAAGATPRGIVGGPDGNVWFVEYAGNIVGKITPAGVITYYPIPSAAGGATVSPRKITVGPDNGLWFTESAANKITQIR